MKRNQTLPYAESWEGIATTWRIFQAAALLSLVAGIILLPYVLMVGTTAKIVVAILWSAFSAGVAALCHRMAKEANAFSKARKN